MCWMNGTKWMYSYASKHVVKEHIFEEFLMMWQICTGIYGDRGPRTLLLLSINISEYELGVMNARIGEFVDILQLFYILERTENDYLIMHLVIKTTKCGSFDDFRTQPRAQQRSCSVPSVRSVVTV